MCWLRISNDNSLVIPSWNLYHSGTQSPSAFVFVFAVLKLNKNICNENCAIHVKQQEHPGTRAEDNCHETGTHSCVRITFPIPFLFPASIGGPTGPCQHTRSSASGRWHSCPCHG